MWPSQLSVFVCILALAVGSAPDPQPITPTQVQYMADVRAAAVTASAKAEDELLSMFRSASFRLGLVRNRAWKLLMTPATELLAQLKGTLETTEYTSNFGVDPEWRKTHPGEPAMGFDTIEKFGRIPNMWELRARNSPLVSGTPLAQWKIMEAAESGLYQLPLTSKPLPTGPTVKEALDERVGYLAGNLRRTDIGIARYGSYAAVLRNSVVHERAPIISTDSGGWQNICNDTVAPITKWFPLMKAAARCNGMFMEGKDRPIPGTADHQLHTILGNTNVFGKLGGDLARLTHQLLTPGATTRPFETLFYTEAGLMGPLRPQDVKLLVASFPGVYGTAQAAALRLYCVTHNIPLAWAINGGETWSKSTSAVLQWLPFGLTFEPVGPDRLLDPLTYLMTNATSTHMPSTWKQVWEKVFEDISEIRNSTTAPEPAPTDFKAWWNRLSVLGGGVTQLRSGECHSTDMCFGTYHKSDGTKDCLCKGSKPTQPEVVDAPMTFNQMAQWQMLAQDDVAPDHSMTWMKWRQDHVMTWHQWQMLAQDDGAPDHSAKVVVV